MMKAKETFLGKIHEGSISIFIWSTNYKEGCGSCDVFAPGSSSKGGVPGTHSRDGGGFAIDLVLQVAKSEKSDRNIRWG